MSAHLDCVDDELTVLALQLRACREPRLLALEVVALLLTLMRDSLGAARHYAQPLALLLPLYEAATDALCLPVSNSAEGLADVRIAADRLACRLFARVGDRGAWPLEYRVPYEVANAIRRTCEPNLTAMLPLLVRDARALLQETFAGPERVDALIKAHTTRSTQPQPAALP